MIYYKHKTSGEIFAYETEDDRNEYGAPDLAEMTPEEVDDHINPQHGPTEADIRATIAAERYRHEISGIVWGGYGIATDRESQQKMSDERSAVKDGLRTDGKGWKCLDLESGLATFRPTSNAEIMEITEAAYRYVSACFDRESELVAAVEDGSYSETMLDEGWPQRITS